LTAIYETLKENSMNYWMFRAIGATAVAAGLMILAVGSVCADGRVPISAQLAEKKNMVSKQQAKRVTYGQRKAAAEALKAERLKIYNAKKDALLLAPITTN
jgi:hypothetical protein